MRERGREGIKLSAAASTAEDDLDDDDDDRLLAEMICGNDNSDGGDDDDFGLDGRRRRPCRDRSFRFENLRARANCPEKPLFKSD